MEEIASAAWSCLNHQIHSLSANVICHVRATKMKHAEEGQNCNTTRITITNVSVATKSVITHLALLNTIAKESTRPNCLDKIHFEWFEIK